MNEVTMQEVISALQATPDGRTQLELATQRAIIEAQRRQIESLSNGQVELVGSDG